jgi:hypothetical protein
MVDLQRYYDKLAQKLCGIDEEYAVDRGLLLGYEAGGRRLASWNARYDVTFLYADSLAEHWRQRLLAFLQSLGPGKIEQTPDNIPRPA